MFFEVPSWSQNCGTTSFAAKCQKTDEFFDILEQHVHQTSIFIDRIESRIKKIIADSPAADLDADPRTLRFDGRVSQKVKGTTV